MTTTMRCAARLFQRYSSISTARRVAWCYPATSRLWNGGNQRQTRGIQQHGGVNDDARVVSSSPLPKQIDNNNNTNDITDDSQEAWEERLKQALIHHKSLSLEKDRDGWIKSVETIRDCNVHLHYFDDALEMEQLLLDKLNSDSLQKQADCFHRMGSLHLQLQHFDKAKSCYQRALSTYYKIHGDSAFHKDMGKLLIGLGGTCVHAGNPQQALPYLAQAEEHYRNHGISREDTTEQPDPHPELPTVLRNQAIVLRMLGQHQVAIDKFQEILAYCKTQEEQDEVQFQIADCLFTLQQLGPALDHFETLLDNEVQRRKQDTSKEEQPSAQEGILRHYVGVIYSKQDRLDDALRELESAYVIKKATLGQVHPEVASSLNGLGAVHASLGNDGEALSYFRESLMIARIHANGNDDSDPQVMQTLRNISLVHGDKVPKWD